jgi:anti-sigma factor ChrR (cupin superfamily)
MMRKSVIAAGLVAAAVAYAQAKDAKPAASATPTAEMSGPTMHVMSKPVDLKWNEGPPSLPPGAKVAVLSGDPKNEGPFVMRLKLPAKYKIKNHWHPAHEHVTVIEGAFWMGSGEKFDEAAMKELTPGSFAMMPPRYVHYAMTKKNTIVQVHGWGPWGINYVNPADDPRGKAAGK